MDFGAGVDQRSQRPFTITQSFLCPFTLANVQYLGDEVVGLSHRIADQSGAYLAPNNLTVFVDIAFFETLDARS